MHVICKQKLSVLPN